ncbi:unnamed protein product [Macrosiphum euphorbiae]|nr:unnamed protein product [Macrosiphum euphorbiae]
MGDTPTNHKSLKDKLIQSSKTTQNSKPNATMTNTAHTANIIDNNTNEPSKPAQHSDKEATNDPIKNIDTNIYNHDFTDIANSIQSVSSDKHSLYQNINIESEKQASSKKSFAETTLNATLPKKEQAIVFDSIDNKPQIEYIIAFSKLIPPKHNQIRFLYIK